MRRQARTPPMGRPAGRLEAIVLLAYFLSLVNVAVHFALIEHTVDPGSGQLVGFHGTTQGRAQPGAGLSAPLPASHGHAASHCNFAYYLAGGQATCDEGDGPRAPVTEAATEPATSAPPRADDQRLLVAPKQSPPV